MKNKKILITAIIAIVVVALTGITCASWLDIKADTKIEVISEEWSVNADNLTYEEIKSDGVNVSSYRLTGFIAPMKGYYVGIPSLYLGKPVTEIAASFTLATDVKDSLIKVVIPSSVEKIAPNAFSDMKMLNEVVFQTETDGLVTIGAKDIGANAFNRCNNLKTITLPSTIITIGDQVLFHCPALTTINILAPTTSINSGVQAKELGLKENGSFATVNYAK